MSSAAVRESMEVTCPATYVWSYQPARQDLPALYEKAKGEQWNVSDLDWAAPVDLEAHDALMELAVPIYGSPVWERLAERERTRARIAFHAWLLSNLLHGEQGALLASGQIVTAVPDIECKLYAATQAMDEARHVEAFSRYLTQKAGMQFPINAELRRLLDQIMTDRRWDMKLLGMQILVEGLALAIFQTALQFLSEPLMVSILRGVIKDEARHVAFGVRALTGAYSDLTEGERREREEFCAEACALMRDRLLGTEVFAHLGLPVEECMKYALESEPMQQFRAALFQRIVPNLKRLGLLGPALRRRCAKLGILTYEDCPADG